MKNILSTIATVIALSGCASVQHPTLTVDEPYSPPAVIAMAPTSPPPPVYAATKSVQLVGGEAYVVKHMKKKSTPTPVKPTTVDPILDQLSQATLVLTAPETATIDDTIPVNLTITSKDIDVSSPPGAFIGAVMVSKIVIASLKAPEFDVLTITPERQALAPSQPTEWQWEITPKKPGDLEILVNITAVVMVDGMATERHIKTFEKTLMINVTPKQRVKQLFNQHWQWLWSTLLVPAAAWLWAKRRKKK